MRKNGFALAMVTMISLLILIMLFGAMAMAHNNVFVLGNLKHRVGALYAAESGVARAIYRLEDDETYEGNFEEQMLNSRGRFHVTVSNPTAGDGEIVITSTGISGAFERSLEVTIKRGAGSWDALCNEGPIIIARDVYINGIMGLFYPENDAGNIHTNYMGTLAIDSDTNASVLISGNAAAGGTVTDNIDPQHVQEFADRIRIRQFDKTSLLSQNFPLNSIPPSGIVSQNTRISGNLSVTGLVKLENDAILHVLGDCTLNNGITGKGRLVVEGTCTIRGTTRVEMGSVEGVCVVSEGDTYLCSPDAFPVAGGGMDHNSNDPVAKFFAMMPHNAPVHINHNLPATAPKNINFFRWYSDNRLSTDPSFLKWRDGDPEDPILSPGLPENVKQWLEMSPLIVDQIEAWHSHG